MASPFIFTRQIDALPAIVKQVAGRCEVYVDGGVTQGTDILKALALGAKMVTCFTVWNQLQSSQLVLFLHRFLSVALPSGDSLTTARKESATSFRS